MRIENSGYIDEDFYVIGPPGMPVYLLDGPMPVLFDAGMTALAEHYVEEIRSVLGGRRPSFLFLTHVHFDHVGAAACFKQQWPEMRVVASERSRDILARPGAVELIRTLNEGCLAMMRKEEFSPLYEKPFAPVWIDAVAGSGQHFDVGEGVTVQALSVPGHTRDFTSYWIESKKILIASEAVGCDDGSGYVQPEFLVNIEGYMANLSRLAELDARILCTGHKMVLTGPDADDHMRRSAECAVRYVSRVKALLLESGGDIDGVTARVKADEWDPRPWPKQPETAYLLNTRQRVGLILEEMNKECAGLKPEGPQADNQ